MKSLSLFELNEQIRLALKGSLPETYWVRAEISEIRENRSGHCYLSLIEKEEAGDALIAQARATIWAYTWRMLKPYFESTTGQPLVDGLKVLVRVSVEFHELYGFSFNIRDIDPTYTLGDLARRRLEIIKRLESEGVLDMNKELEIPEIPRTIAVISSPTAAGYQDFCKQLTQNTYGYPFHIKLFGATMQGSGAENSMMAALDRIHQYEELFDCVIVIRGGGASADLSCFDSYNLAYYVTQFPLPVITGIGHERDETIMDLVSHTRVKTPTAAAEFIVDQVARTETYLDELRGDFLQKVQGILGREREKVMRLSATFPRVVETVLARKKGGLHRLGTHFLGITRQFIQKRQNLLERRQEHCQMHSRKLIIHNHEKLAASLQRLKDHRKMYFRDQYHHLELFEQKARLLDPHLILKRGYSLSYLQGKLVKSIQQVEKGDVLTTIFHDGKTESVIESVEEKKN